MRNTATDFTIQVLDLVEEEIPNAPEEEQLSRAECLLRRLFIVAAVVRLKAATTGRRFTAPFGDDWAEYSYDPRLARVSPDYGGSISRTYKRGTTKA